jgi:hypothetical protein
MSNLTAGANHTCASKLTGDCNAGIMLTNKEKNRPLDADVNELLSSSVEVATVLLASLGSTSYTTCKNQANFGSGVLRGRDDAGRRGHQWRRRPLSTGSRNWQPRHIPSKPPSPPLSRGTRHCVTDVSPPWLASPSSRHGGPAASDRRAEPHRKPTATRATRTASLTVYAPTGERAILMDGALPQQHPLIDRA